MKNSLFIFISLLIISCQSPKKGMTSEEFQSKIDSVEKLNLINATLADGWYEVSPKENNFLRVDKKLADTYYLNPKPIILSENFFTATEKQTNDGAEGLLVYFDDVGIKAWAEATDKNTRSYLVFILDNEILTAQYVISKINDGASAFWKKDCTDSQWERIKKMTRQ